MLDLNVILHNNDDKNSYVLLKSFLFFIFYREDSHEILTVFQDWEVEIFTWYQYTAPLYS